jgi:hypothetical protein
MGPDPVQDPVGVRDLDQPSDRATFTLELDLDTPLGRLLADADQDAERGAIYELDVSEIDDEAAPRAGALHGAFEALTQLVLGREVELALKSETNHWTIEAKLCCGPVLHCDSPPSTVGRSSSDGFTHGTLHSYTGVDIAARGVRLCGPMRRATGAFAKTLNRHSSQTSGHAAVHGTPSVLT